MQQQQSYDLMPLMPMQQQMPSIDIDSTNRNQHRSIDNILYQRDNRVLSIVNPISFNSIDQGDGKSDDTIQMVNFKRYKIKSKLNKGCSNSSHAVTGSNPGNCASLPIRSQTTAETVGVRTDLLQANNSQEVPVGWNFNQLIEKISQP